MCSALISASRIIFFALFWALCFLKNGTKKTIKTAKSSTKLTGKSIKTAERVAKNSQKVAKESVKASGDGTISYESKSADPTTDKCWTISVANGVEFKDYKQGSGSGLSCHR